MGFAADALKPTEELRQKSLPAKEQRDLTPTQTFALSVVRNHRRWLSRDIDKLLTKVWDPSLTNDELLATNDEINRLVKKKAEWDSRLVELGGVLEDVGAAGVAATGYHYYGRAKGLALGNEPTESCQETKPRKPGHLYQLVNAEYYGFDHAPFVNIIKTPELPTQAELNAAILRAKKAALLFKLERFSSN